MVNSRGIMSKARDERTSTIDGPWRALKPLHYLAGMLPPSTLSSTPMQERDAYKCNSKSHFRHS